MRRYIDERTGKIVNVLEKDEANKIVKILIDYFFSESTVPAGRLNLVEFLKDFINLGDIDDLNKIVEYIGDYKKSLKLSKDEEENFEVLYKFFRMYKDLEDVKLGIEDATNYISEMTTKKEEISKKNVKQLDKKDKILKVFFDNGFEFKRLAKVACDAWENHLKEQMSSDKKEVYVSLEQEIAYQDLLEFATSDNAEVTVKIDDVKKSEQKVEEKSDSIVKIQVEADEKNEFEETQDENGVVKIDINVHEENEHVLEKIDEKVLEQKNNEVNVKSVENVESKEDKEEKIPTIQINTVLDDNELILNNNVNKNQVSPKETETHKSENHHKITQHDINSLLGLDDDLMNNSNSSDMANKDLTAKKNTNDEKIPTIQINHLVEDKKENKPHLNEDEKNKKQQGYTSNIHIYVPGADDENEPNNVNPSDVKKATENINLRDSVDFFNDVLDDRMSRSSFLDDEDTDGFRD